jgi:CRP-like cAMP-binding protein
MHIPAQDIELLQQAISLLGGPVGPAGFAEPSNRDINAIAALGRPRCYARNELFLRQGEQAHWFAFVIEGAFREFYADKDGREYNKIFTFPMDFTGSYYDLHSGSPSTVSIEALTDSRVLIFQQQAFQQMAKSDPGWLWVDLQNNLRLLRRKQEKETQLLTLDPLERYAKLKQQFPAVHELVPDYHIASWLGITPSSFSRLKRIKGK